MFNPPLRSIDSTRLILNFTLVNLKKRFPYQKSTGLTRRLSEATWRCCFGSDH